MKILSLFSAHVMLFKIHKRRNKNLKKSEEYAIILPFGCNLLMNWLIWLTKTLVQIIYDSYPLLLLFYGAFKFILKLKCSIEHSN